MASTNVIIRFWSNSGTWYLSKRKGINFQQCTDINLKELNSCVDLTLLSKSVSGKKGLFRVLLWGDRDENLDHFFTRLGTCNSVDKCRVVTTIKKGIENQKTDKNIKKLLQRTFLVDRKTQFEQALGGCS